MYRSVKALLAFALGGAAASVAACGDDGGSEGTTSSGGTAANGGAQGNGESNDGDGEGTAADCPDHPSVTSEETFCILNNGTMTEDLTVGPVDGKRWVLDGKLIVGEDAGGSAELDPDAQTATLTIRPGVTIYGESARLSSLIVARGSKLIANGTADNPIVFTALAEEKRPEQWGGIAINGRATANCGTTCEAEGDAGRFGGPDDDDSSGSLKYVRVEWAGFEFAPGDELNGIAFNGVGSGTDVDYVQVHYNGDDGIEMFGGTVNIKHAVLTGNGDDNIDWQLGWRGKLQYALIIQAEGVGEHGIEADNSEDNANLEPISNPTIANVTMIGNGTTSADGARLRRGTEGALHSMLIYGYTGACLNVTEDAFDRLPEDLSIDGSRVGCGEVNFANTETRTEFWDVGTGNEVVEASSQNANIVSASITAPDARLTGDSAFLTGGSVVSDDDFFDDVEYIGAFDDEENWTEGWTAFPEPESLPAAD